MKCTKCQTDNQNDSRFCVKCGESLAIVKPIDDSIRRPSLANERYAKGKDSNLATIMSVFIPGLGQFYNGDVTKGLVMLVGAFILFATVIGYLAIWVWSITDSYQVAKGNRSLWK